MNPSDTTAINTFLATGGTTGAVYLIVAQAKPFIETRLPPTARLHDPVLKVLAMLLGVAIQVIGNGLVAPITSQRLFLDVGLGAVSGLAAMGVHSLPKPTPAVADPAPVPPTPVATGEPPVQRHVIEHIVTPGVAQPAMPAAAPEAAPPAALVATQEPATAAPA